MRTSTTLKFGAFVVVMSVLTVFLLLVFGDYRSGSTNEYEAVFTDVSSLTSGDTVRVSGLRIGSVKAISLRDDNTVVVDFDADRKVVLTGGTRAAVRYLNLTGDRYLELLDGPGDSRLLPAGAQIPADRTTPALDIDQLLGGLKPVIQGLDPQDVNALTSSLVGIMQGQGGTVESLFAKTARFTAALADNGEIIQQLIDNLNTVVATIAKDGDQFTAVIDRLHRLIGELSDDRDPIGQAIESLSKGTDSIAGLLTQARPPLAGTVEQLARLAPNLDVQKDRLDSALQKAPENYRKLARLGAYGSFFNYYLCGISVRVSDLQGRTSVFPWISQTTGRCAEPS